MQQVSVPLRSLMPMERMGWNAWQYLQRNFVKKECQHCLRAVVVAGICGYTWSSQHLLYSCEHGCCPMQQPLMWNSIPNRTGSHLVALDRSFAFRSEYISRAGDGSLSSLAHVGESWYLLQVQLKRVVA